MSRRIGPPKPGTVAAALVLLIAAAAVAQETEAQPSGTVSCDKTAAQLVDGMMQAWRRADPGVRSLEQRGIPVIEALAEIGVHVDNPDWGKSRSLAYNRAYLDAMGAFVRLTNEEITTEAVRGVLQDATSVAFEQDEDPLTYLERIEQKKALLVEGKLDQQLKETGMSDEVIARLTRPEKITTYGDSLVREITSLAFGRASGLVPVKTFEAVDCDGNSYLGVVAVFSTRMREFADRIRAGDPIRPDAERAGTPVRDRIDALSDDDLATLFGVRRWWDEQGYPVIISFGQWGWSSQNLTSRQRDRRYRFARDQATLQAKSYLAEFVKVSAQFTSESFVAEIVEEAIAVDPDGFHERIDGTDVADRMVSEARTVSTVTLTGLDTLRTWSAKHPVAQHQELTGAVVYWSPAREDAVRRGVGLDTRHAPPEPEPAPASPEEPEPTPGTVQSKDVMDASDF